MPPKNSKLDLIIQIFQTALIAGSIGIGAMVFNTTMENKNILAKMKVEVDFRAIELNRLNEIQQTIAKTLSEMAHSDDMLDKRVTVIESKIKQ